MLVFRVLDVWWLKKKSILNHSPTVTVLSNIPIHTSTCPQSVMPVQLLKLERGKNSKTRVLYPVHVKKSTGCKKLKTQRAFCRLGMSQFVHSEYRTRWVVLLKSEAALMSGDQSEQDWSYKVHTQLCLPRGSTLAAGARPQC